LFYGGGLKVLTAQCIGSAIICACTFAAALAVFGALNAVGLLRVSKEGELEGLDIHEHGISAYPEYVISSTYAPAGMSPESVHRASAAAAGDTGVAPGVARTAPVL